MRFAVVLILCAPFACSRIISRPQVNPCDQDQRCRPGFFCDPGKLECVEDTGAACNVKGRELVCSRTVGECTAGTRVCTKDGYGECSGVMPVAERCNGLDDDCDGESDEDFLDVGGACTVGRGACAKSGVLVCDATGAGTTCSDVPGAPGVEVCNGIDDDCDGAVDNNPADAPLCPNQTGVCAAAHQRCVAGVFVACDAAAYGKDYDASDAEQRCDGLDNDCDGSVDEGYVLKALDVELSEAVPCPQQTWNDGLDFSGRLQKGGNGVPFDDVPAVGDLLSGDVSEQTWFEIENRLQCPVNAADLKFLAGAQENALSVFVPAQSRGDDGGPCAVLQPGGHCVFKAGAALRGTDGAQFTRILRIARADNTTIDTLSMTLPGGCPTSCRLQSVRQQALSGCCEGESFAVQRNAGGGRSLVQTAATPLWANDVRTIYRPPSGLPQALDTEVTVGEVFAVQTALDVNGDGNASTTEDGFVEIVARAGRTVDLGRARLVDDARGGDPVLHTFACFAPIDDTRRAIVFGGGRGALDPGDFAGAMMASSSRGDTIFQLQRGTAMTVEIETATGGKVARMSIGATALSGPSVQSINRCNATESAFTLACECKCRGQDQSCVTTCATECESPTALEGCFSPGE